MSTSVGGAGPADLHETETETEAEPASEVPEPAPRVLVVSLMKSGTHLVQELMQALGYTIYGQSRTPEEVLPHPSRDEKEELAELVFHDSEADGDSAWEALGWAWQLRLGLPLANRYGATVVRDGDVRQALANPHVRFDDTPTNVCWIIPELDIAKVDGQFIQEWVETGHPRIVYVYRDPRDALLSMINFLLGKTGKGYGNFADFHVYSKILSTFATQSERIAYALSAPRFPGRDDADRMEWLLHHPDVCQVSFEELVGPRGGGDPAAQKRAVARILEHLDIHDASVREMTEALFSTDSFTFHKGQIGSWREAFDEDNTALAASVFARSLEQYGYADGDRVLSVPPTRWDQPRVVAAVEGAVAEGRYDIGLLWELCVHQEFDRAAMVPALVEWLGSDTSQRVLDAACGSGLPAIDLAAAGYDVTATDGSADMCRRFEENAAADGVDIRARQVLWEDLPTQFGAEFDVVMCRGGGNFLYAGTWDEDGAPDRAQLDIALESFVACLRPGGRLYIDISRTEDLEATDPTTYRTPATAVGSHTVELSQCVQPSADRLTREWVSDLTIDGERRTFTRRSHWLSHEQLGESLARLGIESWRALDVPGEGYAVYEGRKRR